MKISLLLLCVMAVIGVGCMSPVPANEARFGNMAFRFPLDADITGLELKGPNGLYLKADRWRSKNNPDVINQSAEGQAKIIEATGNVAAVVTQAAISAAAKGAKP